MAAKSEGVPVKTEAPPPPPSRPATITLPPRSDVESIFRGTGASPGPMTLVSSFFADNEHDSECRSFSQLLAGAMASPTVVVGGSGGGGGGEGGGGRGFRFSQNRPVGLAIGGSPSMFTVPPGLSPASLLDSPAFFASIPGQFGMSHQQALAQVTAQAAQSHSHMLQNEYLSFSALSSSIPPTNSSVSTMPPQQIPPSNSETKSTGTESLEGSHSEQRSQHTSLTVDKPADDGYNWRKYGQKQVKGSEYPRSYYKCTHSNCPVKKKVERSLDGQVTQIIYKGEHNHPKPQTNKRAKEGGTFTGGGSSELNGNLGVIENFEGNLIRSKEYMAAHTAFRRDHESGPVTSEQLSGSSDGDEVGDAEANGIDDEKPDPKRRNIETRITDPALSQRAVTEPRIIVQTTSEVDLLDDGYRWRKYGQKVVKGNPNPRSYYKCTFAGCKVRKHVERASTDPKAVITTYEGKHNHDVPASRNSSHNTVNAVASTTLVHPKPQPRQSLLKGNDYRDSDQRPVAVLQLKEENHIP
ncbi:putative WRKY transcription factor 4 [Acorus calamus]|uniref:WRKY transcription factor 4 n=1 Tax=Acorus calamus TaxID=4465 RepID=A0AAV9DXJ7_ACOCL|nr:putative WRKY transcription factor 4 [Acorus calamus]